MANEKRRFAIQLGEAKLGVTEDYVSDGDEIYVAGSLTAVSPTQGRTSRLFLRDPASIVQFSDDLPRQQQLQPRMLFDENLPSDAKVTVVLMLMDADGTQDKFLGDFNEVTARAEKEFQRRVEQAPDEQALRNLVLNGLLALAGVPLLKGLVNLVDPDDVLGREIESFDLSRATSKTARYAAQGDGATYEWGCRFFIGPVEETPRINVLPDPGTPIGTRDLPTGTRPPSGSGSVVGDDPVPTPAPDTSGAGVPPRTTGDRTIGDLTVTPTRPTSSGQ